MRASPPRMTRILETVLYFSDQDRAEGFYSDVLGFRLLDKEPGRSLFYRAGSSVLLLFRAERSLQGGSGFAEDPVAHIVAEGVVDPLEEIHIHKHATELPLVTFGAAPLLNEPIHRHGSQMPSVPAGTETTVANDTATYVSVTISTE